MQNLIHKAARLIAEQNTAFLSSIDENGFPNTKAMLPPRKMEGIKTIYFSTNTSSKRVAQFRMNDKACLYFVNRPAFEGVMLIGTMEVLEDSTFKEMLWQKGDELYYPSGITDPDYCVLKFTTLKGRYYSNLKSADFDAS